MPADREQTQAERETVEAALALDDLWKELGSCETAGHGVDAALARLLNALDAVREERS